jgi:hypothetical protein
VSLESWKTTVEIVALILLGLTFIDGGLVWYFSNKVNEQQAERLRRFDSDLTGAKTELAKQEERAAVAEGGIADAKKSAADALKDAGLANEKTEELRAINLATEKNLEEERKTRLEMESSITPRWLDQSNADALKKFPGIQVVLEYVIDAEPRNAAGQIRFVLNQARWPIIRDQPILQLPVVPFQGVTIDWYRGALRAATPVPTPEAEQQYRDEANAHGAAEALAAFLKAQNWDASVWPSVREELPPNTIKIMIDLKPNPYFLPPATKEALKKIKQIEDEAERERTRRIQDLIERANPSKPPQ